jgi:DNA-binding HxlR family transcriptional regulator
MMSARQPNGAATVLDASRVDRFHQVTELLRCKWTVSIVEAIAGGVNRPGRLERELPGLTTKVLNERIAKLERFGMLTRRSYPEVPPRVEYAITERGQRLLELVRAIGKFVDEWPEP